MIAYWAVLFAIIWLVTRDGPPLRVAFWHATFRGAYTIARTAGRIGLAAEHNYHNGMTQVRGS
jgi:hypothetical protein